jgi:hypothetical protein
MKRIARTGVDAEREHAQKHQTKTVVCVRPTVEPRADSSMRNRRSKDTRVPEPHRSVHQRTNTDSALAPTRATKELVKPDRKPLPQSKSARATHSKKPLGPSNTVRAPAASAELTRKPAPHAGDALPFCPMIEPRAVAFGADMWETSDEAEDEEVDDLKPFEADDDMAI